MSDYISNEYLDIDVSTTSANEFGLLSDSSYWAKNVFLVTIGDTYDNYIDMIKYTSSDETFSEDNSTDSVVQSIQDIIDSGSESDAIIPGMYRGAKYRDTSLGGNDAINPLPQFHYNDDLVHPFTAVKPNNVQHGMGRVYNEMIDDNQQLMYMSFGVPKFAGLTDFYKHAITGELSTVMDEGGFFSVKSLAAKVGAVAGAAIVLPFLPIVILKKVLDLADGITSLPVSKYYDFKQTMPLYYKFVNTILQHIAVNLDLMDYETGEMGDHPFSETGMDIFSIMMKKYKYESQEEVEHDTDSMLSDQQTRGKDDDDEGNSWLDDLLVGASAGLQEAISYVGFRIEKSVGSGESISNNASPSPLASSLNSRTSQNREKRFAMSNLKTGLGGIDVFLDSLAGFIKGTAETMGIDSLVGTFAGTTYIDIPDMWTDSSFSSMNGASFKMNLRAPYGDKYSYFQNICVPLACLLAAALPRATGTNSYTSPFLVNAHSRGRFAINMGIIESITITRGSDVHGWSVNGLPTSIDVEFTIRDLAPSMFLAMNDSNFMNVFATNSTFQSYLGLLGNRTLAETLLWTKNVVRRFNFAKNMLFEQTLNPLSMGYSAANTSVGRVLTAFWPTTKLPGANQ